MDLDDKKEIAKIVGLYKKLFSLEDKYLLKIAKKNNG